MKITKEDRLINSIMAGATIITFIVWLIISKNHYSESFFENFFTVLLYLLGSFFIGNIIIGIPIAIIHYLTNYTFEDFYEFSRKKRFVIIIIVAIICCFISALIIT